MKLTFEWGYHLNQRGENKRIMVDEIVTLDQLQGAVAVLGEFLEQRMVIPAGRGPISPDDEPGR